MARLLIDRPHIAYATAHTRLIGSGVAVKQHTLHLICSHPTGTGMSGRGINQNSLPAIPGTPGMAAKGVNLGQLFNCVRRGIR